MAIPELSFYFFQIPFFDILIGRNKGYFIKPKQDNSKQKRSGVCYIGSVK
jgi:hypothetical protein